MVGSKYLGCTRYTNSVTKLTFKLDRNAANATSKEDWKQLFNSVGLFGKHQVTVSVGFADSWYMDTDVGPDGGKNFSFVALPVVSSSIGLLIVLLLLCYFLKEAANTGIIRDPYAPLRPDGSAAFSLARVQMAYQNSNRDHRNDTLCPSRIEPKSPINCSILLLIGLNCVSASHGFPIET
jgi:hypothetical protein